MKPLTLVAIVAFLLIAGGAFYMIMKPADAPIGTMCPMDARICPDGSSVGRVGPNCEFADCPSIQDADDTDDAAADIEAHADLIKVSSPSPYANVESPLEVFGSARGGWYFEASFPVELRDANNALLAQGPATADGDWMTTEFVPFTATLNFTQPAAGTTGWLILKKDNPSGLPENDDEIRIPVRFGEETLEVQ